MGETTVILGATSGIAQALAQLLASCGDNIVLAARDEGQMKSIASDLRIRHQVKVGTVVFEALDFRRHTEMWKQMRDTEAGDPTRVVLCYGYMADQEECQKDSEKLRQTMDVNLTSAGSILERVAEDFAERERGTIAVISSAAGDRGRATNYIYGASKAGLTAYASGLRNRLYKQNVHVLTIKPGFVDTLMTKGLLNPKSPLIASTEQAANDIKKAIEKKKNILYTRWFWRYIMLIVSNIPEAIFKRLRI